MRPTPHLHVHRRDISTDPAMRFRAYSEIERTVHVTDLRRALRNTGRLAPVLLWQEQDEQGSETGRLILLDGHARLQAFAIEAEEGRDAHAVPAAIFKGTRVDAELAALGANSHVARPLSQNERTNAAWALVRRHGKAVSKSKLAKAANVAQRTIARMRAKAREMREADAQPHGNWMMDRNWPQESNFTPPTDAERAKAIEETAKAVQEAFRVHRMRDHTDISEVLEKALGAPNMSAIFDYFHAEDDDDFIVRKMGGDTGDNPKPDEDF